MNFPRHRGGFTMVELLIVIVIIGVMATLIGPTFTAGSAIVRTKTASRGVIQMSRYARTMALLHQTPVDLVYASDGSLRVEQVGGASESIVSAKSFGTTNAAETAAAAEAEAQAAAEAEAQAAAKAEAQAAAKAGEPAPQGGGASYVMADLNIEKKYEGVTFLFKGYADSVDDGRNRKTAKARAAAEEEPGEGGEKTFRVRYKSNGTCRPHAVQVSAGGEEEAFALTVAVDMLGSAKVEEEDE